MLRINKRDREVPKVVRIESKQPCNPMALHGGNQPDVVETGADDAEPLDNVMPQGNYLFKIMQQNETALEKSQPLAGLVSRQSQSILAEGR